MGDLRNKLAKQEWMQGLLEAARARERARPAPAPPRCGCGLTPDQVPVMLAIHGGRLDPVQVYCPACCPPDHLPDILALTLNNPDAYDPQDRP